ncbi:MAG: hypothetical protein ACM3U2_02040, partial [Deltaproteobacteria bacterium]
MAKRLLTLVLVAAQSVSWGALPVYLCVAKDGSVCVDLGRESCNCCDENCCNESDEHDSHSVCDRSAGRDHDEYAAGVDVHDAPAFSDACGCTHYRIVHPRGP